MLSSMSNLSPEQDLSFEASICSLGNLYQKLPTCQTIAAVCSVTVGNI